MYFVEFNNIAKWITTIDCGRCFAEVNHFTDERHAKVAETIILSLDIIDLPALGIRGNSHFPMMDDNSDTVAALVQEWIESKGLMR